ncbi:MAG: hypothetical protein E7619_05745 [Ruminococcaceae bacterium]|nr:hypothetical protein [Oscillospiraceae bacterium]
MLKRIFVLAIALLMVCAIPQSVFAANSEYVVYSNDFSDPATIADFVQQRGEWAIKDGKLWLVGDSGLSAGSFCHMILNNDSQWINYRVELDVENFQTSTGVLGHVDKSLADGSTNDSHAGYIFYLSNDAKQAAIGRSNPSDHTKYAGNLGAATRPIGTAPGSSVRLSVTFYNGELTYAIYDLASGNEIYTYTDVAADWMSGTVGVRTRISYQEFNSIDTVAFDNLKVTLLGEEADKAKAEATTAVTTEAVTTEAVTTATVTTEAPVTPEVTPSTGDAALYVAAAAVAAGALALIIKRKAAMRG